MTSQSHTDNDDMAETLYFRYRIESDYLLKDVLLTLALPRHSMEEIAIYRSITTSKGFLKGLGLLDFVTCIGTSDFCGYGGCEAFHLSS